MLPKPSSDCVTLQLKNPAMAPQFPQTENRTYVTTHKVLWDLIPTLLAPLVSLPPPVRRVLEAQGPLL